MVSLVNFCLKQGTHKTFWVAYSGGLDSHVLLHALASVRQHFPLQIKAIHVHHGLSPYADDWAQHCANVCADLNIDFITQKILIDVQKGESLEQVARNLRYAEFKKIMTCDDVLLTAHHQNDQAETVLVQLLRGAGPKGLAAMPSIKNMGQGVLVRPLLNVTREELKQYAVQHQLQWIEDESNEKTQFTRNFLRHEVMPLLEKRWPTTTQILSRTAANCADAEVVLEEIVRNDLAQAKKLDDGALSVVYLKSLSPARQRLLLREWFREQSILVPSAKKLHQILFDVVRAREDKSPVVLWDNVELRRYRDYLYVKKSSIVIAADKTSWNLSQPLRIPNIGIFNAVPVKGQGLKANIKQLSIGFRQGGERCRLPGRNFHHALKDLFQLWDIPPWERALTPLIFVGDQLAGVVGFIFCEGFAASAEEEGYLICLEKE